MEIIAAVAAEFLDECLSSKDKKKKGSSNSSYSRRKPRRRYCNYDDALVWQHDHGENLV